MAHADYHFHMQAYHDGLAMGLCHEMAEAYAAAMVRLDQLDQLGEERSLPADLRRTYEQLRALVDLCNALGQVSEARIAFDRVEAAWLAALSVEVAAA